MMLWESLLGSGWLRGRTFCTTFGDHCTDRLRAGLCACLLLGTGVTRAPGSPNRTAALDWLGEEMTGSCLPEVRGWVGAARGWPAGWADLGWRKPAAALCGRRARGDRLASLIAAAAAGLKDTP